MGTCGILDVMLLLLLGATFQTYALNCHKGIMLKFGYDFSEKYINWSTSDIQLCSDGEVCQETLLLVDVGQKSMLVGSKDCHKVEEVNSKNIDVHSWDPAMVIASYSQSCSSHLCNRANNSDVLLDALPILNYAPPGNMKCPVCLEFSGSCSQKNVVYCPKGTSHCYEGDFELDGGGLSATFSLEGCVASTSKTLLRNSKKIGIFSVVEEGSKNTNSVSSQPSVGAHIPFLAWALGLRLSLALCPLC